MAWTEHDQIDFSKHLLQRMCHHQHGQIDQFLGPMLKRDFVSLLPSIFSSYFLDLFSPFQLVWLKVFYNYWMPNRCMLVNWLVNNGTE